MTAILVCLLGALAAPSDPVVLKEDYQVLQRNSDDQANCVAKLPAELSEAAELIVEVVDAQGRIVRRFRATPVELGGGAKGVAIEGLAVGGPYAIEVSAKGDALAPALRLRNVLVGDIWILGGQSNMFGLDAIEDELPALPYLNMLDVMHIEHDAHWSSATPPIHRIPPVFAGGFLKNQNPQFSEEQVQAILASKAPVGGIDCSYFFARRLYEESGVPIGLIPCAVGGSLAIWNPDERDKNRYGFVQHHVAAVGGRVKGLLFFQGEQDAIFGDELQAATKPSEIGPLATYGQEFAKFVLALRSDFAAPDMPAIYAQICRHHNGPPGRDKAWELVREIQRTIPESLDRAHCIPSIDLDVMDGIHLDGESLRRVGQRMAYVALPHVRAGAPPRQEIKLRSVSVGATPRPSIVVEFSGVSGRLLAPGRPTGLSLKQKSTGDLLDWIYKVEFSADHPSQVILWSASPPNDDVVLYYGAGVAPYCNVVDENDMAIPAFGPVHVTAPSSP